MTEQAEYAQVTFAAAKALVDEDSVDFALYLPQASEQTPVLYRRAGDGLSQPDFERMRNNGVPFLCVRSGDLSKCETILEAKLIDLLGSSDIRPTEKAKIVHQVGTSVARGLIHGPANADGLARASHVVDNVIGCVLNDPRIASHMLQMADHERSTASHMFVVSALAIMLGAEIFGPEREMLTGLGLAGMMHDIGKLGINPEVLNKPTPLTFEEMQLIQQHPIESVRLLGDDPHVTPGVRQMILQHHEWVNGRGYPLGVSGDELLPGSRVLSIVDSFHAMIGRRAYRKPFTPHQANRALIAQAGRQFDRDLLVCWRELFERCWSQAPQALPVDPVTGSDEVSSRHEHRPTPPTRGVFGPRSQRFTCDRDVRIKCVYAGRLNDATCAPDEFLTSIHDVSRGGLCIYSGYPMYRGEVVHLQIEQGKQPVWVRGVVAWCRQHEANVYKTGLRFVERIPEHEVHEELAIEGITTPKGVSSDDTDTTAKGNDGQNGTPDDPPGESKRDRPRCKHWSQSLPCGRQPSKVNGPLLRSPRQPIPWCDTRPLTFSQASGRETLDRPLLIFSRTTIPQSRSTLLGLWVSLE